MCTACAIDMLRLAEETKDTAAASQRRRGGCQMMVGGGVGEREGATADADTTTRHSRMQSYQPMHMTTGCPGAFPVRRGSNNQPTVGIHPHPHPHHPTPPPVAPGRPGPSRPPPAPGRSPSPPLLTIAAQTSFPAAWLLAAMCCATNARAST
jgi:hypothetical protein